MFIIQEYWLVLCWEVCPLSECPLSEISLIELLCKEAFLHVMLAVLRGVRRLDFSRGGSVCG